ncbi:MAG TPA: hypothetical protein VIT38_05535 [Allosphingosinicella sp.]|jgi:hypothetical protein
MSDWRRLFAWDHIPAVRHALLLLGVFLIILSPLVGAIPGPGGVFVFAAGFGLVLKYSGWAKRQYVRFKRSHPKKGGWVDWGLRRPSHRRREAIRKEREAEDGSDDAALTAPASD